MFKTLKLNQISHFKAFKKLGLVMWERDPVDDTAELKEWLLKQANKFVQSLA